MPQPPLPDILAMGPVGLSVRDLDRSLRFYGDRLGLDVIERGPGRALVGAGGRVLLELIERRGGDRDPAEAGLFHVALLAPDRGALGAVLRRLLDAGVSLTGAADHAVSEAVYLDDPDGHGLELYADRPRESWRHDGMLLLTNGPFDAEGVLAAAVRAAGLPPGTVVGHVHLESHDLAATRAFHVGRLGLEVMAERPGALFMARGGYHHHLAANVWKARRRPAADRPDRIGLLHYTMVLGSEAALDSAAAALAETEAARRDPGVLSLTDASGLDLRLVAA